MKLNPRLLDYSLPISSTTIALCLLFWLDHQPGNGWKLVPFVLISLALNLLASYLLKIHQNAPQFDQAPTEYQQQAEGQRLIMDMTQRIRRSLDLPDILQTTVDQVRDFLGCDRVLIVQLAPDGSGTVVAESDTYTAGLTPCYLELLVSLQVRANLVVPILNRDELWGLLIAHHCVAPRIWETTEIDLLQQLGAQIGVAIQQAALYDQLKSELLEREQITASLRENQIRLKRKLAEIENIYQSAPVGLNFLDTDLRFVRINQRLAEMNGFSVEQHIGRTIRELLPNFADTAEQILRPILETGNPVLNMEIVGETPSQPGVQRIWLESFLPLKDGDRIIGISTICEEITERKKAEVKLTRAKEELERRVVERTSQLMKTSKILLSVVIRRRQIELSLLG